jgi:hypothetical protein
MQIQPIALAILAEPPFPIDSATGAVRVGLLADAEALNARVGQLPKDGQYTRTAATKAEAFALAGSLLALRERADKYFAAVDAQKPGAASDSIAKLGAVREAVGKSVADTLSKSSHSGWVASLDNHPTVVTAEAAHASVLNFPALEWRRANQEAIGQIKDEIRRLGA